MEKIKTKSTADHSRNFTVLEEIDNLKPTEEEVRLYAKGLGIDPDKEEYLLPIALEGVSAPLPSGWQALRSRDGSIVYQQTQSGIVVYEHPQDSLYRAKVAEARKRKMNSLTDQTESKTVYQQLPEPKPSKGNSSFKIPLIPPAHNDSNSGSGSLLTLSNSNMPHVQSSPTANKTPVAKKVLVERNTNSKSTRTSLNRSHRNENTSPNVDKLSDRFRNEVRVSIPRETENVQHIYHAHTPSIKHHQQPKVDFRSTRKLFENDEDGCASCLFSPQDIQNNNPNNQQYISPLTPGFHHRGLLPDIPPIDGPYVAEFDSNASLRYLLEEQARIHDKIAVLKVTYKAYKARLAGISSSISMLRSTRTAAMLAAGNFSNSRISPLSTNKFHSPSYPFRHRSHSTVSRHPATGVASAISPAAATASETHQKPLYHHQQVQQIRRGDDRDRRFSIQNLTSSKKNPKSAL
nr:centrosomal protein of 164 kDa [Hymenolepis microstoma]